MGGVSVIQCLQQISPYCFKHQHTEKKHFYLPHMHTNTKQGALKQALSCLWHMSQRYFDDFLTIPVVLPHPVKGCKTTHGDDHRICLLFPVLLIKYVYSLWKKICTVMKTEGHPVIYCSGVVLWPYFALLPESYNYFLRLHDIWLPYLSIIICPLPQMDFAPRNRVGFCSVLGQLILFIKNLNTTTCTFCSYVQGFELLPVPLAFIWNWQLFIWHC